MESPKVPNFLIIFLFPVFMNASNLLWGRFLDVEDLEAELWLHWWLHDGIVKNKDIGFINLFYYPFGINIFHTLFISLSAFAAALKLLFPLPLYYNLFIMLATCLNYHTTYLLLRHISKDSFISVSSAVFFVFSNFYFLEVNEGRLYTVMLFTLPLSLYLILRLLEAPSYKRAAAAALSMFLTAFNYIYYGFFLVVFLAAVIMPRIAANGAARPGAPVRHLTAMMLIFILLALPLLGFYKNLLSEKTSGAESMKRAFVLPSVDDIAKRRYTEYFSFFLSESFNTSDIARIPRKTVPYRSAVSFILMLAALLSSLFIGDRKRRLPYLAALAVFFIIWLGPFIDFNKYSISGLLGGPGAIFKAPYYYVLKAFPPLMKFPWLSRLRVFIILTLTMLTALNLSELAGKRGLKKPVYAIAALLPLLYFAELNLFEYNYPPRMSEIYIPRFYRDIAGEKDNFAVIELPLFRSQSSIFFQTIHQRPLLGGNGEGARAEIPDNTVSMVRDNTFLQYLLLATADLFPRISYREEDLSAVKKLGFRSISEDSWRRIP